MATVLRLMTKEELQEKEVAMRVARFERYAIQSLARKVLPEERVSKCLRYINNQQHVEVWKHLKTEKAFFNGLLVCGSVWHCPVCAAKISERRKSELQKAFKRHKETGGKIAHMILTFSHQKIDSLKDNLDKLLKAIRLFRSGKSYQKIRDKMQMIGSIRVFEVTYSDVNGFHPHVHLAIFYKNDVPLPLVEPELTSLYLKKLKKVGLSGRAGIALKLQEGDNADDYLSKWSLENELSKSHIKKGKQESMTPFDLLRKYRETAEGRFLELFKEYANVFKGKRQIYWSNGLKTYFSIEDKSDEELAQEKVELADLLGTLTFEEWQKVLKVDARADLLDLTEKIGFEKAKKEVLSRKEKETSCPEVSSQNR